MAYSNRRVSRSRGGTLAILLLLFFLGCFMVLPLFYTIIQSLKPLDEIFIFPPRFWVKRPTLENFRSLGTLTSNLWVPFSRYLFNSLFVTIVDTGLQVVFASMAAYPLAKGNFPGKRLIFSMVVISLLFTYDVVFIPRYILISTMGLVDTYWGMILPFLAFPLGLYLMRQNMLSFPDSVIESARIDGAREAGIFWRVLMPSLKPVWMTMIVFAFNGVWNMSDSSVIYSEQMKSLPTLLSQISAAGVARMGVGAATSVLLIIPPIVIFLITQSNVIETMASSGLKE